MYMDFKDENIAIINIDLLRIGHIKATLGHCLNGEKKNGLKSPFFFYLVIGLFPIQNNLA
ncbi:hypothetical protein RJ45_13790 [Photobacterium gaetbulicola]|uniref:Uncharacterized protein n=1 Tax=Photobacterium gaetbulicola TaxID=1295392 RepID=A0A0B9G2R2_9GAMM|nr:hypothetical protein RJ45_13790 [Photobacterium gaetbulicola]